MSHLKTTDCVGDGVADVLGWRVAGACTTTTTWRRGRARRGTGSRSGRCPPRRETTRRRLSCGNTAKSSWVCPPREPNRDNDGQTTRGRADARVTRVVALVFFGFFNNGSFYFYSAEDTYESCIMYIKKNVVGLFPPPHTSSGAIVLCGMNPPARGRQQQTCTPNRCAARVCVVALC